MSLHLQWIFGFPFDEEELPTFTESEKEFSMNMMKYWANFAKYGYVWIVLIFFFMFYFH